MGHPMAGHLARAGLHVTVYNRTPDKARQWVEQQGGATAPTPAAAAEGAEIVMMCVGNDHDVRSIALGDGGALSTMRAGSILVDHTTASAEIARDPRQGQSPGRRVPRCARFRRPGRRGERQARPIMVGGDADAFARAEPVLRNYGRAVTLMGGPGSGQLTKMFNQICIAGLVQALAEGINFAEKAGLDVERALDVIGKGAAQSWQMDNRGRTMVADKFDFGFAVDWMRKDLSLCLAEARTNGAALPVTALVDQFYARVQAQGGGQLGFVELDSRAP